MPTQTRRLKRLFWDIETSPNVVLAWRCGFKLNIGPADLIKERAIICICYKWEHEKTVHWLTWTDLQDDAEMLKKFLKVAAEADELVAHNGDRFDLPWFKTRCLFHGLTFPDIKTVDTLKWAKKFNFNSDKLDYIGKFLGIGQKISTGYALWKGVLANDPESLRKMVKYCQQDVLLLERVWAKLRTVSAYKTHAGILMGRKPWSCPRCGSDHVHSRGTRITASGRETRSMQCQKCESYYSVAASAVPEISSRQTTSC